MKERKQSVTGITLEILGKESVPYSIEFKNTTIIDPTAISNGINNYFTAVADKTKLNTKFSPKNYADYLSNTRNIFYNIFTRFPQNIWSKQHTCENFKTPKK